MTHVFVVTAQGPTTDVVGAYMSLDDALDKMTECNYIEEWEGDQQIAAYDNEGEQVYVH